MFLSSVHHGEIRDFIFVVDHEDDGAAFRGFGQLLLYVRPHFISQAALFEDGVFTI